MRPPSFTELVTHRSLLGPYFVDSWARWIALGKALFNEPMTATEVTLFEEVTGRAPPTNQITECDIVVGRGGGKDSFATAVATKIALASYPKLRPGEKATVVLIAVDRAQAAIAFGYLKGYFEECPALKAMVKRLDDDSIELVNNVVIEVHANSFRSVRGRSVAAAVLDEVAFWRSDESAVPDAEVVAALRPGLARMPGSKLILISSAYKRGGLLYQRWHESYGKDGGDVLVARGSTMQFNPSFDASVIEADLARDPELFAAEYLSEWRSDISDFIDRELVASATDDVLVRPPRPGIIYFAFADASAGRGDSFAIAIAHVEGNLVVLDFILEKRSPFQPDDVMDEIVATLRSYGIARIVGDNYASGWVQGAFERRGIRYIVSDRKRSAIYMDLLPLLTTGRARLTSHTRLAHQFLSLERTTTRLGRDEITHPRGGADDLANVAAGAIVLAAGEAGPVLIRVAALLKDDAPVPIPRWASVVYAVLVVKDGMAATGFFAWNQNYWQDDPPPLTLLDCDLAPLGGDIVGAIFQRLEHFHRTIRLVVDHVLYCARSYLDIVRMEGFDADEFPPELFQDLPGLAPAASGHANANRFKLAEAAWAKRTTLPLEGALQFTADEAIDKDPLRLMLLAGIGLGLTTHAAMPIGTPVPGAHLVRM